MRYLLLLCILFQHTLFAADWIAQVLALEGLVKAVTPEKVERALSIGSDIFEKETIEVGSNSRAQIKFTDGGIMNLIPDSEFRIDSYSYRKTFQKDRFVSELLKGGVRTLSGSIAKKNPEGYELKTPSATIGLRGTIIEVHISNGKSFFGISQGRAIVTNPRGSLMIGVGERSQFAVVPEFNVAPILTINRPPELQMNHFMPPQGGVSIDQIQTQQKGQAPTKQAPKAAPQKAPAPEGAKKEAEAPSITEAKTEEETGAPLLPTGGGTSVSGGC